MTGLWASSSQCFSILDQTMGKSGWMGFPIDLVTRCNNNQRFPVNGDVFVPCLSLCEPQKEAPLRFPIHGGLFLSLSSSLSAQALLLHMCSKCAYYASAFEWFGVWGGEGPSTQSRGAFLQSSERQLFALNYKWTRLPPSLASHLSVSRWWVQGSVTKWRGWCPVFHLGDDPFRRWSFDILTELCNL